MRAFLLAGGLLFAATAPAQSAKEAADHCMQQSYYAGACLRPLAEAGNPYAQYSLAQVHAGGRYDYSDINEALRWIQAALGHHPVELERRINSFFSNILQDARISTHSKGHAAKYGAAMMYARGIGVSASEEEAYRWLIAAQDDGPGRYSPDIERELGRIRVERAARAAAAEAAREAEEARLREQEWVAQETRRAQAEAERAAADARREAAEAEERAAAMRLAAEAEERARIEAEREAEAHRRSALEEAERQQEEARLRAAALERLKNEVEATEKFRFLVDGEPRDILLLLTPKGRDRLIPDLEGLLVPPADSVKLCLLEIDEPLERGYAEFAVVEFVQTYLQEPRGVERICASTEPFASADVVALPRGGWAAMEPNELKRFLDGLDTNELVAVGTILERTFHRHQQGLTRVRVERETRSRELEQSILEDRFDGYARVHVEGPSDAVCMLEAPPWTGVLGLMLQASSEANVRLVESLNAVFVDLKRGDCGSFLGAPGELRSLLLGLTRDQVSHRLNDVWLEADVVGRWEHEGAVLLAEHERLRSVLLETQTAAEGHEKENPSFHIHGEIVDRTQHEMVVWGRAIPSVGPPWHWATQMSESNLHIVHPANQTQSPTTYVGEHYFLGRAQGRNQLGAVVPKWQFGHEPQAVMEKRRTYEIMLRAHQRALSDVREKLGDLVSAVSLHLAEP